MSTAMTEIDETTATDTDLLRHFATTRDEAAFAALVRRHGRLVWGVCRRRLARREDAEDAFQAAFLILALKADSIRTPEALPGWLHRTAHRAALRVASASPVDASHDVPTEGLDAFAEVARREAATAIDEELVRLPDRYRNAVVLFHLEGLDRRDVAARLGVSEPTVKGLLTRGRALLRTRLARRGIALPLLLPLAIEPVPAQTVATTCRLALSLTKAGLTPLDLVSVPAKGIRSMSALISIKMAAAALVGAACLTLFLVTRGDANTSQNGEGAPTLNTAFAPIDEPPSVTTPTAALPAATPDTNDEPQYLDPNRIQSSSTPPELITTSTAEQHIRESLDDETGFEFINTPLQDVLQFLGDVHEINIITEEKNLAEAGVSPEETTIELVLEDITLRSGLNILLNDLGLTYVVEDDVLKITTNEAAEKRVSTQAYDVASLTRDDASAEEVAKAVETLLRPEQFPPVLDEEGWAPPLARIVPFRDRLLVRASATDHKRIEDILQLMWRSGSRESVEETQREAPSTTKKDRHQSLSSRKR